MSSVLRRGLGRKRVAVAILLGALSLSGGGSPAADLPAAVSAAGAHARIDAAVVARIVGSANPMLSPRELERIGGAVVRYSAKYDLDPELVTAVLLVESGARPWVRSPKGAMGLMQVMPEMLEPMALAGNSTTIESNVEAGCFILAHNIRRLGEAEGISAYFWGNEIRSDGYLQRVQARRAELRRLLDSNA
ncbi:MAG TPA: transglycosylase SLT domain-containing protein [Myxococcota bacterium]|jgi:soluble lytic murein transglycosylase-like protein|nr:transglycosylase SLT domain-containing protein [Myxococcota bacterium]